MNCNSCFKTRPLNSCSDEIVIGTFAPDTDYYVYLEIIATGNIMRLEATSENDGLLPINTEGIDFATSLEYMLWVTLASATNQHNTVTFTASDGVDVVEGVTCLLLKFEKVMDGDRCCLCIGTQTIILIPSETCDDAPDICQNIFFMKMSEFNVADPNAFVMTITITDNLGNIYTGSKAGAVILAFLGVEFDISPAPSIVTGVNEFHIVISIEGAQEGDTFTLDYFRWSLYKTIEIFNGDPVCSQNSTQALQDSEFDINPSGIWTASELDEWEFDTINGSLIFTKNANGTTPTLEQDIIFKCGIVSH